MPLTRRFLLSRGALFVATSLTAPSFLTRTALALNPAGPNAQLLPPDPSMARKILVVVQLSGGNDGINTVVPFGDAAYATLRPTLAVPTGDLLAIGDGVGFHPRLAPLKGLFDQGKVAVVQGVGYPNPNRSHFRSMDIWHSARPDVFERSGWLGRYLDACQCGQGAPLPAVSIGDQLNTAFWTETTLVPSIANIGAYTYLTDGKYRADRAAQLTTLQNIYDQAGAWSAQESLIRRGTLNALSGSVEVQAAAAGYTTTVPYPQQNGLANQLKSVAQIIHGDLGTRLFSVQMGGFDTHANEIEPTLRNNHPNLLAQFSQAIDAFMQDLAAINRQDDVVLLVFSEFGRRAAQNASQGTDHGTAAPVFLVGNRVRGGLYGSYPSLSALDRNGDLQYTTDFRSVYGAVLRDHLGLDPSIVLAGTFDPISAIIPPVPALAAA